jgi:hypothetical protein
MCTTASAIRGSFSCWIWEARYCKITWMASRTVKSSCRGRVGARMSAATWKGPRKPRRGQLHRPGRCLAHQGYCGWFAWLGWRGLSVLGVPAEVPGRRSSGSRRSAHRPSAGRVPPADGDARGRLWRGFGLPQRPGWGRCLLRNGPGYGWGAREGRRAKRRHDAQQLHRATPHALVRNRR